MRCEHCPWYDPGYGCDAPDSVMCDYLLQRIDAEYDGDAIFL